MKTSFLGGAYQSRSPILSSQTAINIYPESTEGNSDEEGTYYGTPGLVKKFQGAVGEVRGIHQAGGYLYAVIANTVYRISKNWQSVILGKLPNTIGVVSITDNGTQVAFAHQDGWHYVSFTGTSIAPVANSPDGSVLAVQDQYVIFSTSMSGQFGITALADLSTIDPLDVADAEGAPDTLVSLLSDHREVWLFCQYTTEIWSDTGAAFFPFERSPGGFLEQGCIAKHSPTKIDNGVFWLGRDQNGNGVVYRANAYVPIRISTHAIEFAINQIADITDAIGVSYQEEGHSFYWLIFPSGDTSFCYDVATGKWHQRLWLDDTMGTLHRPRANCYSLFAGAHIVGDWQNGRLYELSLNAYTDDGKEIYRERAFDLPDQENKKVRVDFIELDATTGDGAGTPAVSTWDFSSAGMSFDSGSYSFDGSAPGANSSDEVWLQVSRDSGRRFGYKRIVNLGDLGQTTARARWRHLGAGRKLVLRVGTTMANRVQWSGLNFRGEALDQ